MRKSNRTIGILLVLTVSLLLIAKPVYAHKLKLFATADGKTISGYAYLSGGDRLRGQTVEVFSPTGEKLGAAVTNDNGEFVFTATRNCDHLLKLDVGDGHGASFTIKAHELSADLSDSSETCPVASETAKTTSLASELRPLREQLDRLEEKTRLRDVLGGIGYIFGAAGIAFYFLGRRRGEKTPRADNDSAESGA